MVLSPLEEFANEAFHAAAKPIVAAGISLTRNVLRSINVSPESSAPKVSAYDGLIQGTCQGPPRRALNSSNRHCDQTEKLPSSPLAGPGAVMSVIVRSRLLSIGTRKENRARSSA